jgi:hypothetical protein
VVGEVELAVGNIHRCCKTFSSAMWAAKRRRAWTVEQRLPRWLFGANYEVVALPGSTCLTPSASYLVAFTSFDWLVTVATGGALDQGIPFGSRWQPRCRWCSCSGVLLEAYIEVYLPVPTLPVPGENLNLWIGRRRCSDIGFLLGGIALEHQGSRRAQWWVVGRW